MLMQFEPGSLWYMQRPPTWSDMQAGAASLFSGHGAAAALPATCERYVPTGCYHLPGQSEAAWQMLLLCDMVDRRKQRLKLIMIAVPVGKLEPRQAPTPTSKVSFDVSDELGHCPMAAAGQSPLS